MVEEAAEKYGRNVVVCHVLRYTPFYQEIKRIIDSGTIGDVVSVMGIMNVGYWHQPTVLCEATGQILMLPAR